MTQTHANDNEPGPSNDPAGLPFVVMPGSKVVKDNVEWLWKPWIPRKHLSALTGDPGVGKTTVLCEMIAALTTGRALPGQPPLPVMNCWYLTAEETNSDLKWRLDNQKADAAHYSLTDIHTNIDAYALQKMEDYIRQRQIGFTVLDSLTSWLGADIESNAFNQMSTWLQPFRGIAMRTGCAIIFPRHTKKGAKKGNMHAGLGSVAQTAAFRSEVQAIKTKDGLTYLERTKGNIGQIGMQVGYSIRPTDNDYGRLVWAGGVAKRPTELVEPGKKAAAVALVGQMLLAGPRPHAEMLAVAESKGIGKSTMHAAAREMNVVKADGLWRLAA